MNCILAKPLLKKRHVGQTLFYSVDNSTAQQIRNYFEKPGANQGEIVFYYEHSHAPVRYLTGAYGWMTIHFVSLGQSVNEIILIISGVENHIGRSNSKMPLDLCIELLFLKADVQPNFCDRPVPSPGVKALEGLAKKMLKDNLDESLNIIKKAHDSNRRSANAYSDVSRINGIIEKERIQFEMAMKQNDDEIREMNRKLRTGDNAQKEGYKISLWHAKEQKTKAQRIYKTRIIHWNMQRDKLLSASTNSTPELEVTCISTFQWDLKAITRRLIRP